MDDRMRGTDVMPFRRLRLAVTICVVCLLVAVFWTPPTRSEPKGMRMPLSPVPPLFLSSWACLFVGYVAPMRVRWRVGFAAMLLVVSATLILTYSALDVSLFDP